MNKIEQLLEKYCPDGVDFKQLGEVTKILNGFAFKSGKYCDNGIRIIRISDVQKGKMSNKDLKYYPIEFKDEIDKYLLKENDLVMSLTGNVGRVAMLSKSDLPAGLNQRVACIRANEEKILTRFLFHFFDQDTFENLAMSNATGGGQKNMSTVWLSKFQIPIPPIEIQKEIVKILDTFTLLEAELEAELEARKKQYEYYRDDLLSFGDNEVEWKELGEAVNVKRGIRVVKSQLEEVGKYPVYQNSMKPLGYYEKNNNVANTTFIISAGAAGEIGYSNIDFWAADDCFTLFSSENINNKFLYYFLKTQQNFLFSRVRRASIPRLSRTVIEKLQIPVPYKNGKPDLEKQQEIVAILDKFDALVNDISVGLPAELKARRQQYEYYRNKLLNFKVLEK